MARCWSDNVHTTAFTPRDYQVELIAAAKEKNVMLCLGHKSSKEFIALKLLQELGHEVRNKNGRNRKVSLYVTNGGDGCSAYNLVHYLSDLQVIYVKKDDETNTDWNYLLIDNQVVILCASTLLSALNCKHISLENVNIIIIEDCHKDTQLDDLMSVFSKFYGTSVSKPRIVGLAGPIYTANCLVSRLAGELKQMELVFDCITETASDIVNVLRYCVQPIERIVQCQPQDYNEVVLVLQGMILSKKHFIEDHRYDPSEIYNDDFSEELQGIPDPKKEPLEFLDNILNILNEMGPWAADRAAFYILRLIEKQKIKTPYERHFMLLCLISTTFVEIRSYCDYLFKHIDEKQRIDKFSSPKVLRLLEILKNFQPNKFKNRLRECCQMEENAVTSENLKQVAKLHLKQETETGHTSNLDSFLETRLEQDVNVLNTEEILYNNHGRVSNTKGTFLRKGNDKECLVHMANSNVQSKRPNEAKYSGTKVNNRNCCDSDVLCGIVYCNNRTTAKILFNLLSEASRSDLGLSFLIVQYTVDRAADILLEPNEAELEHRIQEEVLKKFRTHECNLLIGTSVLEEGIELPKCNLVVRWDPPRTYRSYVQCKGRVRATNGVHVIMVAPKLIIPFEVVSDNCEKLGHKIMCRLRDNNKKSRRKSLRTLGSRDVEATIIEDTISENLTENNQLSSASMLGHQYYEEDNALFRCILEDTDLSINVKKVFELGLENVEYSTNKILDSLAQYGEIDKLLLQKCENVEPSQIEHIIADGFTNCIQTFKPLGSSGECDSVNLSTAVALLNKYCAKLPSDTFTKLTPLWRCSKTYRNGLCMFLYTLRLPINSPLKSDIRGIPMPSRILARRVAALVACIRLYECGELDNSLKPIGKEAFRITEENWEGCDFELQDHQTVNENIEPKPGTTKRRQYYYKKIASAFSNCRPTAGSNPFLYHIKLKLECPIPEEQNTRGRKVYAPEDYVQGFGILTLRKIPKVSAFPIYTRSGEVRVSLELSNDDISLNELRINHINAFLSYTFTNVLRLQKYLMLFDSEATENCFLIVPTIRREDSEVTVDWKFLEKISKNSNKMPKPVSEEFRRDAVFDPNKFKDAVVMPWYRNQDQPQYFYIAEICDHLSPQSSFPGENYRTFEEYYLRKYGIRIQNLKQPLLDVDHTSARLNFLTPRYVNRKGVALPTSSDETKRAKRENLEQKQILVPELCTIHPFPASLWRVAVCLPCILYRINALLLADEVRRRVAIDIGLGRVEPLENDFEWPILDFGWSLKEVFSKAVDLKSTKLGCKNKPNVHYVGEDLCKIERNNTKTKLNVDNVELNNSTQDSYCNKTPNELEENKTTTKNECLLEIGTWSNDMAAKINVTCEGDNKFDSMDENCPLDNNKVRYASPTSWNITQHKDSVDTSFLDSDGSYNSDDSNDVLSSDSSRNHSGLIRIEFTSENVAEAFETEEEIKKRQKQLALIAETNPNEKLGLDAQNVESGFDCFLNIATDNQIIQNAKKCEEIFDKNVCSFVNNMRNSDVLVKLNKSFQICKNQKQSSPILKQNVKAIIEMVPYIATDKLLEYLETKYKNCDYVSVTLSLDDLFVLDSMYTSSKKAEVYEVEGTGDIFDNFIDGHIEMSNGSKKFILEYTASNDKPDDTFSTVKKSKCFQMTKLAESHPTAFSFDYQPNLNNHPGPSPSIILQALTMSNANDGINLERLETIGDSFLKYAITAYLYCNYENVHEGKLSHLRSKQVSNLNLYRLGSVKALGEYMIASKFEPHDNWLPPCYYVPKELEKALIEARIPACQWNLADLVDVKQLSSEEICRLVKSKADAHGYVDEVKVNQMEEAKQAVSPENFPCFIPYNLVTQHSIPDKSIADCVEALIGAYLIECGARGALIFMAWIGIRVLPVVEKKFDAYQTRIAGTTQPDEFGNVLCYGELKPPKSPLLEFVPNAQERLELLLDGYDNFERAIGYEFKDRSYLLQAMTHASYSPNRLSDCYQRLEFLGDAVLDYLITRHLYEDQRKHSPGALTDLRSALVNNTIFASLAVRHGYHKYFRHLSPGLNEVIDRFVRIQHENNHIISEEYYLLSEEECDEAEDVEVPKALGDIFESVAGAIFLDSNMSLDVVWQVYSNMMRPEIEQFSNCVPKSPIRELLELEPETAKFSKPERLADGRRVRVSVEVFGKGNYKGIGRNYRIAKCTAAKCALRQLRKKGLITKKH